MLTRKLPAEVALWLRHLSQPLHRRSAWRLVPLAVGLLFAQGRRTISRWLHAAAIATGFRRYYYFLASLGRQTEVVAALLLRRAVTVVPPGQRLLLALDDTPAQRYGRHVGAAGIHGERTWIIDNRTVAGGGSCHPSLPLCAYI
jgi:hypothetical protein